MSNPTVRPPFTELVSVVIPVYNAEASLRELAHRIELAFQSIEQPFELIFVEDRGPDGSWPVIQELAKEQDHTRGIRLRRNYGQHSALLCGIRAAKGFICMTMDDDLQHAPEKIPELLGAFGDETDVLYVAPEAQPHGLARGLASRITKWVLSSGMGAEAAARVSAWRIFRTDLRDAFEDFKGPNVNIDVLLTWSTASFDFVIARHEPRVHGESGYTVPKLIKHAMNMMTGFSTLPLQIATFIGLGLSALGLLILAFVVGRVLVEGSTVPGFPFLASVLSIFSGAQLFSLGVIGEYIARIHGRSSGAPTYMVADD